MTISLSYITYLGILFFIASVFGWCMEVVLKYRQYGRFINRGFLIGPYLPIYGSGVVFIVVICDFISVYDDSPATVFLAAFIICGMWEYAVSYFMEKRFHARWWDYSGKPMNINGRVWIGNLILFGLGGLAVQEIANPFFKAVIGSIALNTRCILCGIIAAVMLTDYGFSHFIMKFIKVGVEGSEADNTEDISKEIKLLISDKNLFYSRFVEAYPDVVYRTDKVKARMEEIRLETEKFKAELEEKQREREEKLREEIEQTKEAFEAAGEQIKAEIAERQQEAEERREENKNRLKVLSDSLQDKVLPVDGIAKVDSGTVFDYMKWRGDIPFEVSTFNEVDNLILSQLSYVNFGDIIKGDSLETAISLYDAAEEFFKENDPREYTKRMSSTKNSIFVLREMAKCPRYKELKLFSYIKDISEEEKSQFTVLSIYLGNDTVYISFSGTDDTIVGWHEDFDMAYLDRTVGQIKAADYVEKLKVGDDIKFLFGGHSKGGNLAVTAGLDCSEKVQKRLLTIYNNDGPGFSKEVIASDKYKALIPKIHSVMPSGSIVGVLFDHGDDYKYIESSNIGLKEHDALSWQVLGTSFKEVGELDKHIAKIDELGGNWIDSMNLQEREEFVEGIFSVLDKAGIKTIDDFASEKLANVLVVLVTQKNISAENKGKLGEIFRLLAKSE